MMFKAGKYVIVDLCYVVPKEYWGGLCDQWFPTANQDNTEKDIVTYFDNNLGKNVECYVLGTAHGDGTYIDNVGNEYGVDSGAIGIIAYDGVRKELVDDNNVFDFESDFEVFSDDGILYFGNITINTDYDDYDDNF